MKTNSDALTTRVVKLEAADVALRASDTATASALAALRAADTAMAANLAALTVRVTALEEAIDGPGPDPDPDDSNIYPLMMPGGITNGAPVTMGVGPDTLSLLLSSHPDTTIDNVVAIIMGGRAIAVLVVSSHAGQDAGQRFTIKGVWSPNKEIQLVDGGSGAGLSNLWINGGSLNFLPLHYNGPSVDARGALPPPNATSLWDNLGLPTTWSTEKIAVTPPPPPADESIITGAIGASGPLPAGTLQTLVDAAGASLTLPAGTFIGTASVLHAMAIRGTAGLTTITAAGIQPKWDKGVFVPTVAGVVFEDMIITGARISANLGGNAAAIRGEPGASFTVRRIEATGNQDGILNGGVEGDVSIESCNFHDNGAGNPGSGATHEIYLGSGRHTLRNSRFVCGLLATHAVKSRGASTTLSDCVLIGNGDDGTNGGAVLGVPNAGVLDVRRTSLEIKAGAANHVFLIYGADGGPTAPVMLLDVTLKGNGVVGVIESVIPGVPLTISGTYTGEPPEFRGWGTINNTLVAA